MSYKVPVVEIVRVPVTRPEYRDEPAWPNTSPYHLVPYMDEEGYQGYNHYRLAPLGFFMIYVVKD